jgi:hypothetical protein
MQLGLSCTVKSLRTCSRVWVKFRSRALVMMISSREPLVRTFEPMNTHRHTKPFQPHHAATEPSIANEFAGPSEFGGLGRRSRPGKHMSILHVGNSEAGDTQQT